MVRVVTLITLLTAVTTHSAFASPQWDASASLALGQIDEGTFADFRLSLDVTSTEVDLGLLAPLSLRLLDFHPGARSGDIGHVIRGRDWDELSDVGRVIGRLRIGQSTDPVRLFVGPLNDITIAPSPILASYSNQIDRDRQRAGALIYGDAGAAHLELGWSNVFAADLGWARLAWGLDRDSTKQSGGTVGGSAVADFSAPACVDPCPKTAVAAGEIDASYVWWLGHSVRLSPAISGAAGLQKGAGMAAGGRLRWLLGGSRQAQEAAGETFVEATGEYTLSTNGYAPRYFSPIYEIERVSTRTTTPNSPLAAEELPGGSGFRFAAELSFPHAARFVAAVEKRAANLGTDIFAAVNTPLSSRVRAGILFFDRGVGAERATGERLWLLGAEGSVRLSHQCDIFAQFGHSYRLARAPGSGLSTSLEGSLGVRWWWAQSEIVPR